MVTVQFAIIVY